MKKAKNYDNFKQKKMFVIASENENGDNVYYSAKDGWNSPVECVGNNPGNIVLYGTMEEANSALEKVKTLDVSLNVDYPLEVQSVWVVSKQYVDFWHERE